VLPDWRVLLEECEPALEQRNQLQIPQIPGQFFSSLIGGDSLAEISGFSIGGRKGSQQHGVLLLGEYSRVAGEPDRLNTTT
jgi:hypothetical protein